VKNLCKFLGITALIVVIAFSMLGCDGDSGGGGGGTGGGFTIGATSGRLTITGLVGHNGKYVICPVGGIVDDDTVWLIAAENLNIVGTGNNAVLVATGGLISSESVTLKVWKGKEGENGLFDFNGSHVAGFKEVYVIDKSSYNFDDDDEAMEIYLDGGAKPSWLIKEGFVDVTFINGIGTGTFDPY